MNSQQPRSGSHASGPVVDETSVDHLVRLGLRRGGGRALEDLLTHLEGPDGPVWLRAAAGAEPLSLVIDRAGGGLRTAPLEELRAAKAEGKRLSVAESPHDRRRGLLAYLLALAAAKAQHGVNLSTQAESAIAAGLGDLAGVLTGPLREDVTAAAGLFLGPGKG